MKIEAESVRLNEHKLGAMTTQALLQASKSMTEHLPSTMPAEMQAEVLESLKSAIESAHGRKQDLHASIKTEGFDFSNQLAKYSSLSFQMQTNLRIQVRRHVEGKGGSTITPQGKEKFLNELRDIYKEEIGKGINSFREELANAKQQLRTGFNPEQPHEFVQAMYYKELYQALLKPLEDYHSRLTVDRIYEENPEAATLFVDAICELHSDKPLPEQMKLVDQFKKEHSEDIFNWSGDIYHRLANMGDAYINTINAKSFITGENEQPSMDKLAQKLNSEFTRISNDIINDEEFNYSPEERAVMTKMAQAGIEKALDTFKKHLEQPSQQKSSTSTMLAQLEKPSRRSIFKRRTSTLKVESSERLESTKEKRFSTPKQTEKRRSVMDWMKQAKESLDQEKEKESEKTSTAKTDFDTPKL